MREAIEITIGTENGPEKLKVTSPELPSLWDSWIGGSVDDFDIDEYDERVRYYLDENFHELSNASGLAYSGDMEFQVVGVNGNELRKLAEDYTLNQFLRQSFF